MYGSTLNWECHGDCPGQKGVVTGFTGGQSGLIKVGFFNEQGPRASTVQAVRFKLLVQTYVPGRTVQLFYSVAELPLSFYTIPIGNTGGEYEIKAPNGYTLDSFGVSTPGSRGETYVYIDDLTLNPDATEEKVSLNIESMRVAQTVFEPTSTNGASIDILSDKPYAVEVTISGVVPPSLESRRAYAELYANGEPVGRSSEFEVGGINRGLNQIFIFAQSPKLGQTGLTARIVPVAGDARFQPSLLFVKTINFVEAKLSILINEVTGCESGTPVCFSAPTAADRTQLLNVQIPFAQKILPISGAGLIYSSGLNWGFSSLKGPWYDQVYLDAQKLYIQKKITFKDVGVSLVARNYFTAHKVENAAATIGLVLRDRRGIAFVSSSASIVLAHELLHSLVSQKHSPLVRTEGVSADLDKVFTLNGKSLDPRFEFEMSGRNLFAEEADLSLTLPEYTIDASTYNTAFRNLRLQRVDPSVLIVSGLLSSTDSPIQTVIQRAEANLDPVETDADVVVQGLDTQGKLIATVATRSNSGIELFSENGTISEINTPNSFYAATLPNDGTVTQIRLIKSGKLIFTKPVDAAPELPPVTIKLIVSSLKPAVSYKVNGLAASIGHVLINIEYKKFEEFSLKKNKKGAIASALLLRATLKATLNPTIVLSDGRTVSLAQVLSVVDAEIAKLR